jgi:transposase
MANETLDRMAPDDYCRESYWTATDDELKAFEALVRADEREQYKWDIHSCGPTCKRYACVAMREAIEAEREACAELADRMDACQDGEIGKAIRARGNT